MKNLSMIMQIITITLLLASCSSSRPQPTPPALGGGAVEEYRIGVGDSIEVNIWRNPELSRSVQVRPDGKISMPLIGDLVAADLTTSQLSMNVTNALSGYVKSPQVAIILGNSSSSDFQRRVRITGAVKSPQSLPYRDGMTVLDLVLLAGGPNEFASANKAKLYRKVNGEVQVYAIKLDNLLNDGEVATNYTLQPSDIVTVPERIF
ncbi:MAG: XrtA/PEP-CTERM system exopolysaccharide export protein [Pseudomonadota bacterium]